MDNLVKNIPWDLKHAVNKVKNAVMNYTEMESKVREATNNDSWGASSTLLLEIARGTQNYQYFNEIMGMIYKRFQENSKNWRQVYKTLQLVEYLLKNGSERVTENVKDHLYEFRQLTSYAFVDEKGKDQGLNVRHRAKEIIELLDDPQRLKDERDKAQANRSKYAGVSSEEVKYGGFGGSSSFTSSSSTTNNTFASSTAATAGRSSSVSNPTSPGNSTTSAIPAVKMSSDAPQFGISTNSSSSAAQVNKPVQESNLLDLDFGTSSSASKQSNSAADDWANFASVPTQQPSHATQQGSFANFNQSAAVKQQQSFAGFPSQHPVANNFQQQKSFAAFPTQQAPSSNNDWANFSAAPSQPNASKFSNPMQPTSAAPSFMIQSKKVGDVWNTDLVSLDSLGKFEQPKVNNGPSLNQLGTRTSQPPTPNVMNSMGGGWGFQQPNQVPVQQQANDGWGNFAASESVNGNKNNDLLL